MTKMIIPRTADLDNTAALGDTSDSLRELFEPTLREAVQLEFDQHVGARFLHQRYDRALAACSALQKGRHVRAAA